MIGAVSFRDKKRVLRGMSQPSLLTCLGILLTLAIPFGLFSTIQAQDLPNQRLSREVVTSVERLYDLSVEEADEGRPVHIEGIVLYSDPAWNLFWLLDETGRMYLPIQSDLQVPPAGTLVALMGTTAVENGVVQIDDLRFREIGLGQLPSPEILMPLELTETSRFDGYSLVAGTVIEAEWSGDDHLRIVVSFLKRFQVQVYINNASAEALAGLLGAQVEVVGCVALNNERLDARVLTHNLFVPDLSKLTIFQSGPTDPFRAPHIPLNAIQIEYEQRRDPRLVHLRGKVVEQLSDLEYQISNGSNTARIRLVEPGEFNIDDEIEIAGSILRVGDERYVVDRALARIAAEERSDANQSSFDLPVLYSGRALHSLTREMADMRYPVEIEGVVTYYDSVWRVMFVHDGTRGFYVDAKSQSYRLRPSDQVLVRGQSDPGGFAPMVIADSIEFIGHGEMPNPISASYQRLLSGAEDSQWIELSGVIETAEKSQSNLVVTVRGKDEEFEAVVCGEANSLEALNWIGSSVSMTGVCGVKSDATMHPTGIYLHVPNRDHVQFLNEAPADPYSIETTDIESLGESGNGFLDPFIDIKIEGVVTFADRTGLVALQDDQRGMIVRFKSSETPYVNDRVEIIGTPIYEESVLSLRISDWRKQGTVVELPEAQEIDVSDFDPRQLDGKLVSIEATVLRNYSDSAAPGLTLQSNDVVFSAELAMPTAGKPWSEIQTGSVISLEGVLDVRSDDWERMESFRLLCPPNARIKTIQAAPWWSSNHTMFLAGGLASLCLLAFIWGITLKTTVANQTKRIGEELAAKGEIATRYNTLVENAGELIFSLSRSGRFISLNPATERVFDVPNNKLIGRNISDYLAEDCGEIFKLLAGRLTTEQPHAVIELTTNRNIVLETAIRLDSPRPDIEEIQCISRDVSERRNLERQLRQMQKMDSVGQLAAGVAHDYNNLLTVVRMNSELLLNSKELPDEKTKSVSLIYDAAERASTLTNQLLAFGRRQAMNSEPIDLGAILSDIAKLLEPLIGHNIDLTLSVNENLPVLRADSGMIQQAIMNLALNARDAMPEGGTLAIGARAITMTTAMAAQRIEITPGEYIEITVTDNGIGIEPEVLTNIFEPFFTTKEVGKGTGLGLSTVFGIVKQHEGCIEAASTPGEGSRFSIYLPTISTSVRRLQGTPSSPQDDRREQPHTILLVEDDSSVRLTISKVLERAGYTVIQSVNGPEALEIWNRMNSEISLVITDMVMPGGMTGSQLAKKIKESNPGIPIIYCTGYSSELMSESSLSSSEQLLTKPFEANQLLHSVQDLISN